MSNYKYLNFFNKINFFYYFFIVNSQDFKKNKTEFQIFELNSIMSDEDKAKQQTTWLRGGSAHSSSLVLYYLCMYNNSPCEENPYLGFRLSTNAQSSSQDEWYPAKIKLLNDISTTTTTTTATTSGKIVNNFSTALDQVDKNPKLVKTVLNCAKLPITRQDFKQGLAAISTTICQYAEETIQDKSLSSSVRVKFRCDELVIRWNQQSATTKGKDSTSPRVVLLLFKSKCGKFQLAIDMDRSGIEGYAGAKSLGHIIANWDIEQVKALRTEYGRVKNRVQELTLADNYGSFWITPKQRWINRKIRACAKTYINLLSGVDDKQVFPGWSYLLALDKLAQVPDERVFIHLLRLACERRGNKWHIFFDQLFQSSVLFLD